MKPKLLQFALLLGCLNLSAQSMDKLLEQKYENYRDRQRKYFVQIGEKPGQSQIAASLEPLGSNSDTFYFENGTLKHGINTRYYKGAIKFGDAAVDHGFYLAVLASEFRLLILQGRQNTDAYRSLCIEIYFAINAIDRLDYNAEPYLKVTEPGNKNGFFIRSDHDENYINRLNNPYWDQRVELLTSGGAKGPGVLFIDSTNGVFNVFGKDSFRLSLNHQLDEIGRISWVGGPGAYGTTFDWGNEMSQDQLYGLLMGFMCIKQWVNDELVVDPDGNQSLPSKNIHSWVAEITARIVTHVSKTFNHHIAPGDISNEFDKYAKDTGHLRKFIFKFKNQYYIDYNKACKNVADSPYIGNDSVLLSIPDTIHYTRTDSFGVVHDSIVVEYYSVNVDGKISTSPFPGSRLRSCNFWEEAVNRYDKKKNNFTLFKESNYIITNPIRDNKEVTRGHLAIPFGYAIRESAKYITGADTFPVPSAKLSTTASLIRYGSDAVWILKVIKDVATFGANPTTQVGYEIMGRVFIVDKVVVNQYGKDRVVAVLHFLITVMPFIGDLIQDDPNVLIRILEKTTTGCPYLAPSADLISLCIVGRFIEPQNPDYWRDLWNAMKDKKILMEAVRGSFTANLQHNLAIASRTWGHDDFAEWCDDLGYKYSELFYCMLHGGNPKKSKSFYQTALLQAQCEGTFNAGGYKQIGNKLQPSEPYSTYPFNTENRLSSAGDSGTGSLWGIQWPGLDYMLLFNLYKMADIQKWKTGGFTEIQRPQSACPCVSYPDKPYIMQNRSILEKIENNKYDTIDGKSYNNLPMFMPIFSLNGIEYLSKPVYNHYTDLQIRIPNFLLHSLEIKGSNASPNPNIGKLIIEQDLTICKSDAVVKQYGEIEVLANANAQFPSLLTVNNNGTLEIQNSAIVRVNNNARLVIEPTATLYYKTGARIILNGPNAVLHIKGKLVLAPGAEFKIEGGSLGKGYVIWDNGNGSPHYGLAELDAGTGSTMVFEQTNNTQVALKVEGVNGFYTGNKLNKITVKNCRVDIGPASRMVTEAVTTDFNNVKVFGFLDNHTNPEFDYKITSKGVHQLGRKNNYKDVEFNNLAYGLSYLNLGGSLPMDMENITFNNCLNAVVNRGGRVLYNNGALNSAQHNGTYVQLRNGITGIGTQGASHFNKINSGYEHWWFSPVYHPLSSNEYTKNMLVHGNGGVYLYKCSLQRADYGVQMDQAGIHPICTDFYDNATQAMHTNFSRFTAINNSYNQMSWSANVTAPRTAFFGYMGYLYLNNGANRINGHNNGNPFVFESLAPDQAVVNSNDPNLWNSKAIPATGNQWQVSPYVATYPASAYNSVVEIGGFTPYYIDINKVPYKTGNWDQDQENYCASYKTPFDPPGTIPPYLTTGLVSNGNHADEVERTLPIKSGQLGDIIAAHGGDGNAYANTLKGVLVKMNDTIKDYNDVIDTLRSLFLTPVPDTIAAGVKHIYSLLQDMYVEVRADTNIAASSQEAVETSVFDNVLQLQNQLIALSSDTGSIWRFAKFELVRDKALIYRVFNQRNEAMNWLNSNIAAWDEGTEKVALVEWNCLINLEQLYIDSVITYDSLTRGSCLQPFTIPEFEESAMIQPAKPLIPSDVSKVIEDWMQPQSSQNFKNNPDKNNTILYPNPAEDAVFVASKMPMRNIVIRETNGRLLYNINAQDLKVIKIDATGLVRGMYIVEIYSAGQREIKTLVINK